MKTPLAGKKYFFFDIDGTLTDEATHKIVPSAEKTLHLLQENGHFVAIATGRVHYKAVSFTDRIGIRNLVCSGGGCLVIDGKIEDNQYLEHDAAVELLRNADARGIGWILILDDTDRVYMRDLRFLEQAGRRTELTTYILDPDLDYEHCGGIFKIYLAMRQEEEADNPWINTIGHLRMGEGYCVWQYDKKKDGILRMMKHLQADPSQVVVFGDAVNDLVMFDPQWFSIAMGNGMDELKRKADYVTAANTDDGIQRACLKFGWIRKEQLQ